MIFISNILYIDDKKQIPNIFYSRLDNHENVSNLNNLSSYSGISSLIPNEESRRILAKLARNIKLIISEYSGNRKKRCRDVNYWFDEKIKNYTDKDKKEIAGCATSVCNDVMWNKIGEDKIVCLRKENPYQTNHAYLMKKLDDYCEIRDNNGCNVLKNINECLKYNKYIKKKKHEFTTDIQDICSTNCNRNEYKIDDNCTLNDMDLTFPEINCEALYKKEELLKPVPASKERSPLEIGFFIIVSFILFYLFILFLEKVK
ncbi:hypothetical protein PVIIG_05242 [Plasmodium vivax India VII]|uniref:Uncharacterized protein n=1 Tax=Plasmodium vivax India VII TaxID=1077284 RepID=A0A0J9S2P8_PLAVI|nr:hypothetical protein PVIIG_05242 [Plasmodium vivax India VII]